jgi:hypothetical protein
MPTANIRLAHVLLLAVGAYLYFGLRICAQTVDPQTAEDVSQSWTTTTDLKADNVIPTRVIESHNQNGNRTVDKQSVQIRRVDGDFKYHQDIETETLQVDTNVVRITTRRFGRDGDGKKKLVEVTEEEKHSLPGGDSNIVRLTSVSDLNGVLQPVRRDIVETKRMGTGVEETNATLMLPSINGGWAPAIKTHEVRKRGANDIESQQTTLLPDGAANWQVSEMGQVVTKQENNTRTRQEHISRRDAEGKLAEISLMVSKESESASGERHNMVESYSVDVPGSARDGSLHLVERTTTTQRTSASGEQIIEQRVEQPNPGDPNSGLRLSELINDTVRPGPSGVRDTRTIEARDVNGNFGVVEVDTTNFDKVLTIQIQ